MGSMNYLTVCVFVGVTVCLATAASFRVKRQAVINFNCPQGNGSFVYNDDCSKYWRCDEGLPTLLDCPAQLLFNSQRGYCDWPEWVSGTDCRVPTTELTGVCAIGNGQTGVLANQAFHVAHPNLCNAFYTCAPSYLHAPCTFCPEAMYYDRNANECKPLFTNTAEQFCNGLEYVSHDQKVFRQIDGSCWPFTNIPNPLQELANRIAQGDFDNNRQQG